jgi:hypothetical protein
MTFLNVDVSAGARLGRGDLTIMSALYGKEPLVTRVSTVCSQRLKLWKGGTLWVHPRRKSACPGAQIIPRAGSVKRDWPAAARKGVRKCQATLLSPAGASI